MDEIAESPSPSFGTDRRMAVDYLVQAAGTVSQVRCQGVETYTKRRKYIKA